MAAPEKFHGLGPFDVATGKPPAKKTPAPPNFQDVFGRKLLEFAKADRRIVGITAAMPPGTGLSFLRDALPQQFHDVGIAEEHAVLFAAGLACEGMRPVVAIYSTFLQRAYDPIIHDICLQNLAVTFCMDRAGLSPNDGATHHGLFDIAYLRCVPNAVVMQPCDEDELADMLWTSLQHNGPAFIRYPRGAGRGVTPKTKALQLPIGKAVPLREGREVQLWALGPWVDTALELAARIAELTGWQVGVVNARFAKPLDRDLLQQQAANAKLFVTMEDHVIEGGFGSIVSDALQELDRPTPLLRIGYPDRFIDHGSSVADLRAEAGLSDAEVVDQIVRKCIRHGASPTTPVPAVPTDAATTAR
jgi:1-deoxy-D-xylulose-5-phosphate synthase